jgi:threonine/homoserine/homoserine lactone efflux protein
VSIDFLLTSLVVVLIPGTGVVYTVSTALFQGWRVGVAAALGCTLGIVPHLLATILGLTAILHMSALAFQVLKYLGVAYLLYIAWGMWRDRGALKLSDPGGDRALRRVVVRGILINILNPKLTLFFLAFLPQFIATRSSHPLVEMLFLSGVFMAMTLVVFMLYGAAAHGVRRYVINSPRVVRWLQRGFAGVFAMLGAKLALAER